MKLLPALMLLVALAGCKVTGTFACEDSAQCRLNGLVGTCELTGFCSFDDTSCPSGSRYDPLAGGGLAGQCVGGEQIPDGPIDTFPATCGDPGQRACDGRVRRECGDDHMWNPALDRTCDFTCVQGACVSASNVPAVDVAACGPAAPRLTPSGGATVTLAASGITCAPDCGDVGVVTVAPTLITTSDPDLAWFCLSSIDLAATVTVTVVTSLAAIALVVDGNVAIATTIDIGGQAATAGTEGGVAGPGGFTGAPRSNVTGAIGGGTCGGLGGINQGSNPNEAGGGGGGGGYASIGGFGGTGRDPSNTFSVAGGAGGAECGTSLLIPLAGGSGGGGGGDGSCASCGWAGGGGAGAIQISSRASISIAGTLFARGGAGFGIASGGGSTGGGGGGGAGGGILLEARSIDVTGALSVDGGNGGSTNAGPGGVGAIGPTGPTDGSSFSATDQGGAGAGGAGGRIRLGASNASCTNVSPLASCTTGPLVVDP